MTLSSSPDHSPLPGSPIRAVILDYGDVISHPADPAVIAEMAEMFRLTEDRFRQIYGSFRLAYDRGTLDATQYWSNIALAAGTEIGPEQLAELRRMDVAMWSRLNTSVLRWGEQLRDAGMKTAVLSNMHLDMVQHVQSNCEWTRGFDCVTLSSAIGMAKPDAEIFKYCLKDLNVAPQEALFIDDRERNVAAAQALGIRGIVAPSMAHLRAGLATMGFRPLPE